MREEVLGAQKSGLRVEGLEIESPGSQDDDWKIVILLPRYSWTLECNDCQGHSFTRGELCPTTKKKGQLCYMIEMLINHRYNDNHTTIYKCIKLT